MTAQPPPDGATPALDVRPDVMEIYNWELAEAVEGTVWSSGCQSYVKTAGGGIATQLPHTPEWYEEHTDRFCVQEYELS